MDAKRCHLFELVYYCASCNCNPIAIHDQVYSRLYKGAEGRGYLFRSAFNVTKGPLEERQFTTGLFTVSTIACCRCNQYLGWHYVRHLSNQKKKEV